MDPRENLYETYRLHQIAVQNFVSSKSFSAQSSLFSFNSLLLSSKVNKSLKAGIKKHSDQFPLDYSTSLLRLPDTLPETTEPVFTDRLAVEFHRDKTDVGLALLLIQAYETKENIQAACSTLLNCLQAIKDPNVKYAPGLMSLASSLLPKVGKDIKLRVLIREAKEHWASQASQVTPFVLWQTHW
jgi:hypothetical protein